MGHCKICHAVIAVVTAAEIICASCQGRQDLGFAADKSFEIYNPEHTEREEQEIISFPRDRVTFPTSAVPFIPSSYDPSVMLHYAHKKYIDDYYACVLKSYLRPLWAPLAAVSSQSPPS